MNDDAVICIIKIIIIIIIINYYAHTYLCDQLTHSLRSLFDCREGEKRKRIGKN
jgi:hypothetical protein